MITQTGKRQTAVRAFRSKWILVWRLVGFAVFAWIIWWALKGIDFDFTHFKTGIKAAGERILAMFPRTKDDRATDLDSIKSAWQPLVETFQMALVGVVIAAVCAFPVSFLAARTTSFFRPLSILIKTFLNMNRAIPVLVYALIVVSVIGLGAPAGTVALAFGGFVMLSKLYAEALESISPGPIEAVKSAGGNPAQIFAFAMLPQVFPNYLSATLYAFEISISASAILGFVGAGGIGFMLQNDIQIGNDLETGVLLGMLILLVNLVNYISFRIRSVFA